MPTARVIGSVLCLVALLAGCQNPEPAEWPSLDLEEPVETGVQPPAWYTPPTPEPAAWPAEPEPEHGTAAWRQWCDVWFNPRAVVDVATAAPVLDAQLDDAAWLGPAVPGHFVTADDQPATPATIVRLAYDEERLYVAVRLEEPDPSGLRALADQRDGPIQIDDHFELILGPGWRQPPFPPYRFRVSPKGVLGDAKGVDARWNADVTVAAAIGDDAWTVEMSIPLAALGADEGERWGEVWACTFVRRRMVGDRVVVSSWTRPGAPGRDRINWGHVIFRGPKPVEPEEPTTPSPESPEPPAAEPDGEGTAGDANGS